MSEILVLKAWSVRLVRLTELVEAALKFHSLIRRACLMQLHTKLQPSESSTLTVSCQEQLMQASDIQHQQQLSDYQSVGNNLASS